MTALPENSGNRLFIIGTILTILIFGSLYLFTPDSGKGYFKNPPEMKYLKEGKLIGVDLQKNAKIAEFLPQDHHLYLISMEDETSGQNYRYGRFHFWAILSDNPEQYLGKKISFQYYHPEVKARYRLAFMVKMLSEDYEVLSMTFFMGGVVIHNGIAPLSWADIVPSNKGPKIHIQ